MKRHLAILSAATLVAGSAVFAGSALANSFAVSVGVPGLAVGFSNHGGYVAAVAPPVYGYAAPAPYPYYDYAPAPVYYGAPVVYAGPVYYHRPWAHRYYRHW